MRRLHVSVMLGRLICTLCVAFAVLASACASATPNRPHSLSYFLYVVRPSETEPMLASATDDCMKRHGYRYFTKPRQADVPPVLEAGLQAQLAYAERSGFGVAAAMEQDASDPNGMYEAKLSSTQAQDYMQQLGSMVPARGCLGSVSAPYFGAANNFMARHGAELESIMQRATSLAAPTLQRSQYRGCMQGRGYNVADPQSAADQSSAGLNDIVETAEAKAASPVGRVSAMRAAARSSGFKSAAAAERREAVANAECGGPYMQTLAREYERLTRSFVSSNIDALKSVRRGELAALSSR